MGIMTRKRADGKESHTAQLRLQKDGAKISENRTFETKRAAKAWIIQRTAEIMQPGAFKAATEKAKAITLADAIQRAMDEHGGTLGKTKLACLQAVKRHKIAAMECSEIRSADIVAFAGTIGTVTGLANPGPSTIMNYMSHMSSVFAIAEKAWGYPLSSKAMSDAMFVLKRQKAIAKSNKRTRRPTLAELDKLLAFFADRSTRAPHSAPMVDIVLFATFSARRMEEITKLRWSDLESGRILVRNMKHPGQRIGNDIWTELPPEAEAVILRQPRAGELVFPYSCDAISAAFTRACHVLGIDDLHFHDLRHEGVSRLFEAGWGIPHVALVSGHRSWASLQRYAQLRQKDDKFAGWKWRP